MSVDLETPQTIVEPKNAYDEVPYLSYPYAQSHPNRLAVIAHLFGMEPKPIDGCRVLELGCASGGNLIPMAAALPGSHFIGIDSSQRQIEAAQKTVQALGLQNIELQSRSILEIGAADGEFDYIIAHGVYSWVPAEVREHLLAICGQNLGPQGVAYVSYNTYPGWRMRGTIRDMMVYHARKFDTPKDRVGHSRALLDFLVKSVPEEKNSYGMFLRSEMDLLRDKSDSYLLHEHLENINDPVYFYEFEEQAALNGLQYLGEADIGVMSVEGFGEQVSSIVKKIAGNLVELEQYMDFLRNRMFRQTLLCHKEVTISRRQAAQRLSGLHVASPVKLEGSIDVRSDQEAKFTGPSGSLSTRSSLLKAALQAVTTCWPQAIPFDRLLGIVQSQLYTDPVIDGARSRRDADALGAMLLEGFAKKFIDLYAAPPQWAVVPGKHPTTSSLARYQAQSSGAVTNLRHHLVALNDLARHVVRQADGQHSREEILDVLSEMVERGELVVNADGGIRADSEKVRSVLTDALDQCLGRLALDALLAADSSPTQN